MGGRISAAFKPLYEFLSRHLNGVHRLLALHRAFELIEKLVDGATIAQVVEQRLDTDLRAREAQGTAGVAGPG